MPDELTAGTPTPEAPPALRSSGFFKKPDAPAAAPSSGPASDAADGVAPAGQPAPAPSPELAALLEAVKGSPQATAEAIANALTPDVEDDTPETPSFGLDADDILAALQVEAPKIDDDTELAQVVAAQRKHAAAQAEAFRGGMKKLVEKANAQLTALGQAKAAPASNDNLAETIAALQAQVNGFQAQQTAIASKTTETGLSRGAVETAWHEAAAEAQTNPLIDTGNAEAVQHAAGVLFDQKLNAMQAKAKTPAAPAAATPPSNQMQPERTRSSVMTRKNEDPNAIDLDFIHRIYGG